jgi:hypothetical protein
MRRYVLFAALAATAAFGGERALAQSATAKCTAAKMKCVTTKATALLGCHNKAEGKGVAVDPLCVTKAEDKFDGGATPSKGCVQKTETKPPCATTGDVGSLESLVDDFVDDVVTDLDPGYPTPVLNKCSAGKKKCVANKVKALLGCYGKNTTKPDPAKFEECVAKAKAKFDGGADPAKGCFAKLEAKPPKPPSNPACLTTDDTAALETKVDDFVTSVDAALNQATNPTVLDFTLSPAGGPCGETRNASSGLIKTLTCGGLNIGGGGSIVAEGPTPDGSISRFSLSCAGTSCTLGSTSTPPTVNTAGPDCTDTGCNFGTPLPIPNAGLSTCVLNTWTAPASGTVDLTAGTSTTNVPLQSHVVLTGNAAQPCPKCSAAGSPSSPGTGTCDRGPRAGLACTTTNSQGLTRDCLTGGSDATHPCTPGNPCLDGTSSGRSRVSARIPVCSSHETVSVLPTRTT